MKRILLKVALAILTFGLGTLSSTVWNFFRFSNTQRPPTGVSQKVHSYWIYTNQMLNAEPPGSESFVKVREDSVFIVFYPTGEFASVGCALYSADGGENTRLMAEDEFTVYRGHWRRNNDGTIATTWRLTHKPTISNHFLPDERTVIFKPIPNQVAELGLLAGGGHSYVQMTSPKIANLELLSSMITADNR